MEEILGQLLRVGTGVVAVSVYIMTFFLRRLMEIAHPELKHKTGTKYDSKAQLWWNEIALYAIPVVLGCCMAFIKSDWLFGEADTIGARVMFGGGVGWFSSFLYKAIRKAVQAKAGVSIRDDDEPPGSELP